MNTTDGFVELMVELLKKMSKCDSPEIVQDAKDTGGDLHQDLHQPLMHEEKARSLTSVLARFTSLRAVIICLIVALVIMCCVFVWLASYVGSSSAINTLSKELLTSTY